ncbi:hypothetical protein [Pseudomonas sp. Teo4]|uniref:hypothetical protein n=1 Tax=Pseudomonas sp. Teo4 TaxID=3064528 RepID=UPI002AB96F65|nr:hypothetical protein [Pseudomonas sp. Teo4]MDZ3991655.1 hypothetical protein [Pseudomonas sp. Teo4]
MTNHELVDLLKTLSAIYHREGCFDFDAGIGSMIDLLSRSPDQSGALWQHAASSYRTMAVTKSGFSDVYVDAATAQERVLANIQLDGIRQTLWETFKRA